MRARTGARLPSVSRHWTKEATSSVVGHVVLTAYTTRELNVSRQFRRLAHHAHRVLKQDRRLVALGRSRVNLRARLAIGCQAIQADSTGKRRLTVTLALLDVRAPESPRTVSPLPPKDGPDNKRLRR